MIALAIGIIGVVLFLRGRAPAAALPDDAAELVPPVFPPKIIGDNKFYKSPLLRFSILFPKSLRLKEYGKGNTSTIVFEDETTGKGFQVFVVPYGQKEISAERFKMDAPSGIREEPTDVIIDGIRTTMFFGRDSVLGDTREVWFINHGFLYEVTARKELDAWLAGIMQTWRFSAN